MLNDLLFEIGTEELPSGAVNPLGKALTDNLVAALARAGIAHGDVRSFAAPRRLGVLIHDVNDTQPGQNITRRGPAVSAAVDAQGNPSAALQGFARSCGVAVSDLTTVKTDKGEWYLYETVQAGAKTCDLLPSLLSDAVAGLPIAKPMRWGAGDTEFARPVHWVVLLFGQEVIPARILGVEAGRQTRGHRYHHPDFLVIASPRDYESQLADAQVVADFGKRRQLIVDQIGQLTQGQGKLAVMPEELVDEVTSIVEWPVALVANFDKAFLEVPAEVLIAAMQSHQKSFALRNEQGQLLPQFITIANIASSNPEQVIAGNESVMHARLSDAAFFYHQDKKQPLSALTEATTRVMFQQKLGTLADKTARMQAFLARFANELDINPEQAQRAALLSKCDLMTGMVGEFPELQGLMGYYYALADGEPMEVAVALNEQYKPRFAADSLPDSSLGMAMSLADRLDTLVGTFMIGQKPTGAKDPFKLRRHALAVVRMLISSQVQLNLSTLVQQTRSIYGGSLAGDDAVLDELRQFVLERLQSWYQGQGIGVDMVNAVRARQDDWLLDLDKRLHALRDFVKLPEAQALSAACKRVNNLLQHAAVSFDHPEVDESRLVEASEKSLLEQLRTVGDRVAVLHEKGQYGDVLAQLASLRDPVDTFFDQVMVMVDDLALRENRLKLLSKLQGLLQGVADISLLQTLD